MNKKFKKRPWFQFHLSTAIVLMFVASGLLWLNMRLYTAICWQNTLGDYGFESGEGSLQFRGWPRVFMVCADETAEGQRQNVQFYLGHTPWFDAYRGYEVWSIADAAVDATVALIALLVTAFLCEWLIRRKSAKAGPPLKKRPWFQYHSSTAVVLMFVAGGLMGLNLLQHAPRMEPFLLFFRLSEQYQGGCYGWPMTAYPTYVWDDVDGEYTLVASLDPFVLVVDIAICLAILCGCAIFCECRIRRKSAQAEPPKDGTT